MFLKYQQLQARQYREEDNGAPPAGGDNNSPSNPPNDPPADPPNELQAQFEAIKAENERLNAKIGEANKHAKAAERQAAEEARAKAEAEGNFKQLFESSETERQTIQQQLEELQGNISNEKRGNQAMKLASELAEGHNVELLADFIARRLKVVDNSIKVIDDSGNLTVSTIEDLKKEFQGSARYSSLIAGNKSSGGSALGGVNSSGATGQTITRAEFKALNPVAQSKFARTAGNTVTD